MPGSASTAGRSWTPPSPIIRKGGLRLRKTHARPSPGNPPIVFPPSSMSTWGGPPSCAHRLPLARCSPCCQATSPVAQTTAGRVRLAEIMRIIGGTSRGRRLSGPRGAAIRPTADQVKGALFNILADRIVGARFLDLFAGTGNIGLEALSRGATQATFVESNPIACRLLEANVRRCGFERAAEVRPVPVSRFLKHTRGPAYDIVFLDPPYETQDAQRVLPSVGADDIIQPHGVVV